MGYSDVVEIVSWRRRLDHTSAQSRSFFYKATWSPPTPFRPSQNRCIKMLKRIVVTLKTNATHITPSNNHEVSVRIYPPPPLVFFLFFLRSMKTICEQWCFTTFFFFFSSPSFFPLPPSLCKRDEVGPAGFIATRFSRAVRFYLNTANLPQHVYVVLIRLFQTHSYRLMRATCPNPIEI